jgi:hypothetical protein
LVCAAGAQAANTVRIVSPAPEALITTGRVAVRVRITGRVTGVHVYLRARRFVEISRRFRASGAGIRTVNLRIGRDLVFGRDHLYVQVRRPSGALQTESVHFTVARRLPGLLAVHGLVGRVQQAPVTVRLFTPDGSVVRATLNGRGVGGAFRRLRGGGRLGVLAAVNGLRFGRNALVITAFSRRGVYSSVRRTLVIPRTGPLANAGRNRRVRLHSAVRLDGTSTRVSHAGHRLRMSWQIVSAPRGSGARLRGARGVRPMLLADIPGIYTVRMRCVEMVPVGRGRARTAGAPASDTVNVTVQPDVLPQGVPVTTLASDVHPGVEVGSTFYPIGAGWLQMVVLDRATLAPSQAIANPNKAYPPTVQGMAALSSDVSSLTSAQVVILSGSGVSASLPAAAQNTLAGVFAGLGGVLAAGTGSAAELVGGQWSLIGIPGLPKATAYQLIGQQLDPGAPVGSISGYFELDTSHNFAFTWPPSYHTFDTEAPGSTATENVIAVDSHAYASQALPNQTGFHVVWLDPGTLALRGDYTALNAVVGDGEPCGPSANLLCLDQLDQILQQIVNTQAPALLLVSAIGNPQQPPSPVAKDPGDNSAWADLAQLLASMGAQQFVLLGLNGTGGYSFIGDQGLLALEGPNSGTELSQSLAASPTARLAGVFARNREGNWTAGTNGSPAPGQDPTTFQPSLLKILAQSPQPFPPFNTPAKRAAETYINTALGLPPLDPQFGIRATYWLNQALDWNNMRTTLEGIPPCPTFPCSLGFPFVEKTLDQEFGLVSTVTRYFTSGDDLTLSGAMTQTFLGGSVDFEAIANDILKLYNPPPAPVRGPDSLQILSDSLTIASGATGVIPVAGAPISGAFGVGAGVTGLIDALSNMGGGAPNDPSVFQTMVLEWGHELTKSWRHAIGSLGQIDGLLLSDPGRLAAAARLIDDSTTAAGWGLTPQRKTALTTAWGHSIQAYLWQTMLPVAANVVPCTKSLPNINNLGKGHGSALLSANWVQPDNHTPSGLKTEPVWGLMFHGSTLLGDDTLGPVFSPPTLSQPDNLGLEKPYFFAQAFMVGNTPVTPGFTYVDTNHVPNYLFAPLLKIGGCL